MSLITSIIKGGFQIGKGVTGIVQGNDNDKRFRDGWTQQQLGPLGQAHPQKNIMIVCVKHDASQLKGVETGTITCDCPSGAKITYQTYFFDEGVFLHQGDGGFLNWCFCGNFVRDGDKVTFSKPA